MVNAFPREVKVLPREELEVQQLDGGEYARDTGALEVTLNHRLLREGGAVIMSPCNDVQVSVMEAFRRCIDTVVPVIIYGIDQDKLSPRDMRELQELKSVAADGPFFFLRTNDGDSGWGSGRNSNGPELLNQLIQLGMGVRLRQRPTWPQHQPKLLNADVVFAALNHVRSTAVLNDVHTRCLNTFIVTAFDLARDMVITPRRLGYAREKEAELYLSLYAIAERKQTEMRSLIGETVLTIESELIEEASTLEFSGVEISDDFTVSSIRDARRCQAELQDLVLTRINCRIADKLIGSVEYMKDSWVGTLERCLFSLQAGDYDSMGDDKGFMTAGVALKQILNAAYQVEITPHTSSSFVRVLLEKLRRLLQGLPGKTPPLIDRAWKRKVAADMLHSLSESKLAQNICEQFKLKLTNSHEMFLASLRHLEQRHKGRLERTEDLRLKVRKLHAPQVARLSLESRSLKDMIEHGMPSLRREIGRGQYGVVYACDHWAGYSPCAVKSVIPPDDKHWNDLALEFHYTKSIPEHPRVVNLRGSVIDYGYGTGSSPAVLLVMDRAQRDFYSGIKTGMTLEARLVVALDVVEGIRFLHGQGLVHRDIKLKNVLLDHKDRGKITDLGFCKPHAMMSGSIVGTPIHMAPELFSGSYDNSVDTYAFGILFWYACSGSIKLPRSFELCSSKDQLWNQVKKGVRPERKEVFKDRVWFLMEKCWNADPKRRPLLGEVQEELEKMLEAVRAGRELDSITEGNSTFYLTSPE